MSAEVYCDSETYESGPGTFTPAATITITFTVTVPPPGPAQTYS
jgi:hypothetical protein